MLETRTLHPRPMAGRPFEMVRHKARVPARVVAAVRVLAAKARRNQEPAPEVAR
jgi:hypothetical protein